ncbi:MAG: acyl-CoA dehydrogenase family protein [Acidimicrobiia bacterium]
MRTESGTGEVEDVGSFRERARTWLAEVVADFEVDEADLGFGEGAAAARRAAKGKAFQAAIWAGGFAGIAFPKAYGGLGLTGAHRDAFNAEVRAAGARAVDLFNLAGTLWGLSIGMIAPTMLEFATEEQKATHIPAMLRGEKLWAQMLSEPTGGSDLAGAITRATRDGDQFVLNGSKVWTSQADVSDMAVLLARTNWDVPKHRGLSMFIVEMGMPGMTVVPLRLNSGSAGFCQEFFDDMAVPAENVLGAVDDGWNVASRLLVHERNTVGGGSVFHSMSVGGTIGAPRGGGVLDVARARGVRGGDDADLLQLVVENHVRSTVSGHLAARVVQGMASGAMPPAAGSLLRLFGSEVGIHASDVGMALGGNHAVAWAPGHDAPGAAQGVGYLGRQGGSMASGTAEIQKNIISERVLGLPREPSSDRDTPFRDVRTNRMPTLLSRGEG